MEIPIKMRSQGNILLVDKDPEVRREVMRLLAPAGYCVFAAEDGYQAFLLSESLDQPLHLLLAEVRVGADLSGVELARHLQVLRPGLLVLYLSTIPGNPELRRELQAALDTYLSKPFSGEALLAKVGTQMEKSRAQGRGATGREPSGPGSALRAMHAWKSRSARGLRA
jgi:DNA-binding response OmpR family regulator